MRNLLIGMVLAASLTAGTCRAGQMSIRLVKATNSGNGSSSGIEDVAPVLARNLPYKSFQLVASSGMSLPASDTASQLGEYTVECNGKQDNLSIKVVRGGRQVLRTTAVLHSGKPLIVGGFPISGGKLILVFVVR